MIERLLPGSITVDCCWHDGRVYVVRHSPPQLVVESFDAELEDRRTHLMMPFGANAGARICSWGSVLWVAYRDETDFGHLLNLDTAEVTELGLCGGQRPFALGDGWCAWVLGENPMRRAKLVQVGQSIDTAITQAFADNVPTGLSHIENGQAVSWDSQRQLQSWGINFVRSGLFLVAQGKHDDGLIGTIDGQLGHLLLWRDGLLNDQRVSANGDSAAVIAWQPGASARVGIVSAADLVLEAPEPPIDPIPAVNRALWFGAYDRDHDGTFPGNCRIRWSAESAAVLETLDGKDLAYYVAGDPDGDPDAIERAVAHAKTLIPTLPVLAYVPHGVRLPANAHIIGAEHYQKTWETLQQFEDRRRAVIRESNRPVVVIGQCYTSNAHNTKHLKPLVPVFGRILRDEANVIGFVGFSAGRWRATGYEDHPEVHALYQQLSQSISTPTNGGGGGPVPNGPSVEILEHDKKVARNDPKGLLIRFDVSSDRPITRIALKMVEDHEPPVVPEFTPSPGNDGRYVRALAFKPVRNGTYKPRVTAWDDRGASGSATSVHDVEVTETGGGGGPLPPGLMAPNVMWAVQRAMNEHPEINPLDEVARGRILDYACVILNGAPWGRKARNQDGSNKNTDGMCFLRSDGKHEIYDSISGHDGSATWEGYGPFDPGENGWWAPHEPV